MSETKNDVLKVRGFIYKIFDTQTFKNDFTKREFILETRETGRDGKIYTSLAKFNTVKSFTSILDNIGVGSEVVVYFALDGKEWKKPETGELVYIAGLRSWKIDIINNTNQNAPAQEPVAKKNEDGFYVPDPEPDDLPF